MKIAIAGYGQEGEQNYRYFSNLGHDVTIVDEKGQPDRPLPDGASTILGNGSFRKLDDFDMVVRTAGLSPKKISTKGKIWSATNEFFTQCPAPIIGVTGTKGKGTTCSLITSILRASGKTVHLVGNIGQPALEILPEVNEEDIVVYELSSFQLWDIEASPHIAVVLMIEPDHLDVHADMADYISAKTNIVRYQTANDVVVFNQQNEISRTIGEQSIAQKMSYPFAIDEMRSSIHIPGEHNVENASAAIAAVREYVNDPEVIKGGLATFEGLPHRLRYVHRVKGVDYYDDSISTTPGSAIAAIRSFTKPILLILGGHDKGGDYLKLIQECRSRQVNVLAIGSNSERIAELCDQYGVKYSIESSSMQEIVNRASTEASSGSVVVLSPAAASFDMFKNYSDRGDQFVAAVNQLKDRGVVQLAD